MKLTQERAKELFRYREDGVLIWASSNSNRASVGNIAGSMFPSGYVSVQVDGKRHYIHRLVWLFHHGYLPEHQLDHIDRNKSNNRIENLREVSQSCNNRNQGNPSSNTSGVKGVSWCNANKNWTAKIEVFGRTFFVGCSTDFLEAVCHRLAAEQFEDWSGCDSNSPAFQYVKKHIDSIK